MRKNLTLSGFVPITGVLMLMILAYMYANEVSSMYNERMRRDNREFTQALLQQGVPPAQVGSYRAVLVDVKQNTLSYVNSETTNIIFVCALMAIVIMSYSLTLAGRLKDLEKVK